MRNAWFQSASRLVATVGRRPGIGGGPGRRGGARQPFGYANGITYARLLTAIRLTPMHTGIAFLHGTMERQRHSLVLDPAEVFKPLFAEPLLLRLSGRGQLKPQHFDANINQAMLSDVGRKLVVQTVRDELAVTVQHRALGRKVACDELLYLEALQLTRTCLEKTPYKPFRIWW